MGAGQRLLFASVIVGLACAFGGCSIGSDGGASDVPCFEPVVEGDVPLRLWLRPDGQGGFLMTWQSRGDILADIEDGSVDAQPHDPRVYRFDVSLNKFVVVDGPVWDTAATPLQDCCPSLIEDGPLQLVEDRLIFEGRTVPVVGGRALDMDDAPTLPVAAVLSTNGSRMWFGTATGQHYHQLFSKENGRPIGPAVRLGVGGRNFDRTFIGWTDDELHVLYRSNRLDAGLRFCVVSVGDLLADLREEQP